MSCPSRVPDRDLEWTHHDEQILWWVKMRARTVNLDCRQWDRLDAMRMLESQDDRTAVAYAAAWDHIVNIRGGGGVMIVAAGYFRES